MKRLLKHIFLFLLLLQLSPFGGWGASYAQLYPVQLTPVFNSPYSVKLSDYATSMDTKMQLLINPTDISINNRQVRLKFSIQGNGINAQSSGFIQGQNPIFINGGELQTLTNVDIAALFRLENLEGISAVQYANPLPEGMYNFCFELYDFITNQKISQKSCASLYLILNDPPLLNTPQRNEQIASTEFPNILFTWTPRQINATNVSYKFELKQLIDPTLDPQFGFQMAPVLYEETLFGTALLYNLNMPILTPGMRYAWRVRAISTTGLSESAVFKNDGYSEIYSFKYTGSCAAPTFVLSEAQGNKSVKISWQGIPEHTRYQIQYKKQDVRNAQWFSVYSLNTQSLITNLEPGVTYQFRVGSSCDPVTEGVQSFTYSAISTFTTPTETKGVPAYNCGIVPKIDIQNQKPLDNLIQSETFTAGDFPVTVLELEEQHNPYSGKGYIIVPYLADTKIAVEFKNITINTDYQLISGVVETSYNPDWKNVVDVDPLIEEIFGPQTGTETVDTNIETSTDDIAMTGSNNGTNTNNIAGSNTGTTTDTIVATGPNSTGTTDTGTNTNTGTTTSAGSNSDNGNVSSSGTNTSGSDYYIEYKGAKYYTGGKIKIAYKRSMNETFEMKTVANDTKVDWTIHEVGKQELWRGYAGYNIKTNLPIEEPSQTLVNLLKLDLEANAINIDGKPKVRVEIEKVVTPFVQNELTVKQRSVPVRIAKAGEILYFVNKPTLTDEKYRIVFEESSKPNQDINLIPKEFLKWSSAGKDLEKYKGQRIIGQQEADVFFANEKKDFVMTSSAGYPILTDKSVSIKWVDEGREKFQVVPPAIQTTAETIFNNLTKLNDILKAAGINNVLEIKPKINISGNQFNEIDKESRHYNTIREGEINATVEAKATFNAPAPYSGKVKIPFTDVVVVDYGLYLAFKLSLGVQGKLKNEKREDQTEFKNTENSICVKASGGIEPGLKLNILPGQDNLISVTGKAYGKAEITATGCYIPKDDKFKPKVILTPLVVGFNINVKTGGVSIFDDSYELTLSDKIKIYGE
jgi:hypothetical protein